MHLWLYGFSHGRRNVLIDGSVQCYADMHPKKNIFIGQFIISRISHILVETRILKIKNMTVCC